MKPAVPEIRQDGLDVSAEEERYLKRVFRRSALPYLLVTWLLVGVAIGWNAFVGTRNRSTTPELQSLVAEAASLREAISAVRSELQDRSTKTGSRLDALEGGLARLKAKDASASLADLATRVDRAGQRIDAIEGRLAEVETATARTRTEQAPAWPAARPSAP